jgi:hypothetical protein
MKLPLWQRDGLSFLNADIVLIPDTCHAGSNPKFCIAGDKEGVCADPFEACDPIRSGEICIENPDWTDPSTPVAETPAAPETPATPPTQ